MRRPLSVSVFFVFALSVAAAAQSRGTQAEQEACTPDVFRLCSAYIPNEPSIIACLQSRRQSLSQACHDVFYPRRAVRDLDMTSTGSIRHARKAKPGYGRISAAQ